MEKVIAAKADLLETYRGTGRKGKRPGETFARGPAGGDCRYRQAGQTVSHLKQWYSKPMKEAW